MKIAMIIIRSLLGLLFLFASVTFLFHLTPKPELQGDIKLFNEGMEASRYLMPTVKVIELICALALLSGRYVTLVTIVIFPITVNIFLFHAFLAPEVLPVAIFVVAANLFLAYYYRKNYASLFVAK